MRSRFLAAALSAAQLLQYAYARPQASQAPIATVTISINTAVCSAANGLPPASTPTVVPYTTTDPNGNVIVGSSTSFYQQLSSTPYVLLYPTTDSAGNVYTATTISYSILPTSYPYVVYFPTTDAAGRVGIGSRTAYTTLPGPLTVIVTSTNAAGAIITSASLSSFSVPTGISYSYEYYSPTVIVYTTTDSSGSTITTSTTSAVPYTGAPTVVPYTYTNGAGSIVTGSTTSYLPYSSPAATYTFTTTLADGSVSVGTSVSYGDFIYTPPGVGLRGGIITPYTTTLPNGQVLVAFSTSFPPTSTTPASVSATASSAPAFTTGSSGPGSAVTSSAAAPITSVTVITTTDSLGLSFVVSSTSVITPSPASSSALSVGSTGSAAASSGSLSFAPSAGSTGSAAASSGSLSFAPSAGSAGSAAASSGSPSSTSGNGAASLSSALGSSSPASSSVVVFSTTNSAGSAIVVSSTASITSSAPAASSTTCTKNTTVLAPAPNSHSPCPQDLGANYNSNNCVAYNLYCTVDFSQNDVARVTASSLRDCISLCDTYVPTAPGDFGDLPCVGVTFASDGRSGANCYLKSSITQAAYGSDTLDSAKLASYNPNISNISVAAYSSSTTYSTAGSSAAGGSSILSPTSSVPLPSVSSTVSPGVTLSAPPSGSTSVSSQPSLGGSSSVSASASLGASPSGSPSVSSANTDTTTTTTTTSTAPTPPLGGSTTSSTGASSPAAASSSAAALSSAAASSPAAAAPANSHAISRSATTIVSGTSTTTSYSTVYAAGAATYTPNSKDVAAPDSAYGPCSGYGADSPPYNSTGNPTGVSTQQYTNGLKHTYNIYCGYISQGNDLHYPYNSSSFADCIAYCDSYVDPMASQPGSSSAGTCVAANWGAYNSHGANCFLHIAASDIVSSDPQFQETDFYQDLAVQRTSDPFDSTYVPPSDPPSPCDTDASGNYPNDGTSYNGFTVHCAHDGSGATPSSLSTKSGTTFKGCIDTCAADSTCNGVTWATGSPSQCYFHGTPTLGGTATGLDTACKGPC